MDKLEEAYHKGHIAYHDGYTLKYNPYKRHSEEWEEWRIGWNDEKCDDPYWEKAKRTHSKFKNNEV